MSAPALMVRSAFKPQKPRRGRRRRDRSIVSKAARQNRCCSTAELAHESMQIITRSEMTTVAVGWPVRPDRAGGSRLATRSRAIRIRLHHATIRPTAIREGLTLCLLPVFSNEIDFEQSYARQFTKRHIEKC